MTPEQTLVNRNHPSRGFPANSTQYNVQQVYTQYTNQSESDGFGISSAASNPAAGETSSIVEGGPRLHKSHRSKQKSKNIFTSFGSKKDDDH